MNYKHTMKTIIMVLALLMGSASEAWADAVPLSNIIIEGGTQVGETNEFTITNGSVTRKSVEEVTGGTKVTITVTPASGYSVETENIVVQKLQDMNSAQTRSEFPIADKLDVTQVGETNDYTFVIPDGYAGALVSVTFTQNDTTPDYSGIYYLQSKGGNAAYYMVPSATEKESGKPYVQTDKNLKLPNVWKLKKVAPNSYHIIHYSDGKYMIADKTATTNTVWLETVDDPATLDDNAIFEITKNATNSGYYNIKPKGAANADYLTVSNGDKNNPILGLGTVDNDNSLWKMIDFIPVAPTFSVSGIKVTINNPFNAGTIYYTTDGNDPTTGSTQYTNTFSLQYGPSYRVKAICVYHDDISNTDWTSEVATSSKIQVALLNPIISRSGNNVTITSSQSGVRFRYNSKADGTDPTDPVPPSGAGTNYSSSTPPTLTDGARNVFKAIAYNTVDERTYTSGVVTFVVDLRGAITISSLEEITSATGSYKLASGFSATGTPKEDGVEIGTSTNPFRGTIDGDLVEFELSSPLFDYVQDATIKNVMISKATISTSGNAGAIANNALGATRIYNCGVLAEGSTATPDDDGYTEITSCSSTISGSGYVGGIVGLLDGSSRVINCFSYANIISGDKVGGIVGWNNVATTTTNQATMVMNCMFYGDITGGNSKAPIYNGSIITNRGDANGVSNFNYFWAGASYVQEQEIDKDRYNCALSAETRYLQRFEFFRHLLNSNRALAAWWATGSRNNKDDMMKWVLEPEQIGTATPYPILKEPGRYRSVVYIDDLQIDENHHTGSSNSTGTKLGELSVTIEMGDGAVYEHPTDASIIYGSLTLDILDKDPDHFNFNYKKVQLPYYNDVGTKNYTGNRVVTGWKITSITGGGTHEFTSGSSDASATVDDGDITLEETPYNFADRKCTDKDLYSVSGRIFNQGAYWDVPDGVTAITIQPYWAKAAYLADANADVTYNEGMTSPYKPNVGGGQIYNNNTSYEINGDNNQKVYTSITNAIGSSALNPSTDHKVYDYAVVLVGNYHHYYTEKAKIGGSLPYTVTSIDLDGDNEPDYSYILRFDNRCVTHPVRVDFLNIPGLGMAQKSSGGQGTYNFGIMQPKGWFEATNTAVFRFTQFEYDLSGRSSAPMIMQGGVIEQWVTYAQGGSEANAIDYYHVGGNVWFKEFHVGQHQDRIEPDAYSPHPPISVTGGDYGEFYLTGLYNTPTNNYDDNAECYINGGRFGKVAGTGMQGIGGFTMNGTTKTSYSNGNIIWQIDNADIDEFYAGGINAAHIAEGNIYTVISNSRVDQFCGGPKFGDMNSDKIVVTNATNCTFRTFFGAGYGGNSYNRMYPKNKNSVINIDWNDWVQNGAEIEHIKFDGYKNEYSSTYKGVGSRIDYQFLPMSSNKNNVARLFVDYVSFSLATTFDVTSKLTGCTITKDPLGRLDLFEGCLGNFYGGGSLGKVTGPVKSTLTNCTVKGNVYGAGYSATLPSVKVMGNTFQNQPHYDENLGAYLEAELPATEPYTWEHKETVNSTETAIDTDAKKLFTEIDTEKSNLGSVSGAVTLTITTIDNGETSIGTAGNPNTGNVYGGGQESYVKGSDNKITVTLAGNTTVTGNVFGGGDEGLVEGSTEVNIQD